MMTTRALAHVTALALALVAPVAGAQTKDSLRLYYVGRPVGWETFTLGVGTSGVTLDADLDYIDRGRRNHIVSKTSMAADYSPRQLDVARVADTSRTIITRVDVDGRVATVTRNGATSNVDLPHATFAISPYTPVSQHLALLRYWQSHGSPRTIAVVPGGPVNVVAIKRLGADTVSIGGRSAVLGRYSIDGVVWGLEYLWLDARGNLAMFASAAGGLSFKAVAANLVPAYQSLMDIAGRAAMTDLAAVSARTHPVREGTVALVGATLIDGTGRDAIPDATVVVENGRIVSAGPSASTKIPSNAKRVDVRGKTIVPGLWDMHAHLHQLEWLPVYIAAGITTVRDMGNETPFLLALRKAQTSGRARGPHILAAGLVDGGGPNAFGALSATTPDEGRRIVRDYHALGFEQMKLYSLLSPAVVAAICDEAHRLGMTVTGHIPNSLTLLAAVDSGMDQVAHQPVRGDPASDSVKRTIEQLRAKGTVIDPTVSWAEIGGHSTAEPLQSFQPVTQHLPPAFVQFRVAGWGSAATDTAAAHQRLARQLATIAALHSAGVPIVAGTDEGVPGFSVYREIELYVKAGMSPMDAIRAATAVPAKVMRLDTEFGTLEAGKRADLLVLDANPLTDIANIRTVRYVVQGGKVYDSAALWRAAGFTP
jgi:imidazolonepropionase-like amidohydrolase